MIWNNILNMAPPGTVIPKPAAKGDFVVDRIGKRRGETALIYTVPNHKNPKKPYKKGITISEFERAHQKLVIDGEFTRRWFRKNMPRCNSEGGCNFTTIGGLFVLIGEAEYIGIGVYTRIN